MKYIVLLLLLFTTVSGHAQRMIVENGAVYIESFGVRSDLLIPNPALKIITLPDNTVRTVYHKGVTSPLNILMGRKIQIAKKDAGSLANRTFYVLSGFVDGQDGRPGTTMTARPADGEGCDDYYESAADKGKWRVPTINEYALMAAFITDFDITELNAIGFVIPSIQRVGTGVRKMNFVYTSSTTYETNEDQVYYFQWYPAYHTNLVQVSSKTSTGRVRCVMDIE